MHKVCKSVATNAFTLCNRMGGSPVDGQRSPFDAQWRMPLALITCFVLGSTTAGAIFGDYIPIFTKSFGSEGTKADQAADQSEVRLSEEGLVLVDFYFIMVGLVISLLISLHDRAYANFLKEKLNFREHLDRHLRANSVVKANSSGSFASALSFRVRLASLTMEIERSQSGGEAPDFWTSPHHRSNGLSPFFMSTSATIGEEVGGSRREREED